MKRLIIDTDTASDDAVAIIMALREKSVNVEALTLVAGNVPLEMGIKNALVSIQEARTYTPKVFAGMAAPLLRDLETSEDVHGEDGMGNMGLEIPDIPVEKDHAVDAIIDLVEKYGKEIEIITLGPLTNLAMACLKAPEIMRNVAMVTIMGGAGLGSGNITAAAEFNIFADAEAAQVVLRSGMPLYFVGWDVSMQSAFLDQADIDKLMDSGSPIAEFCVRCNERLKEFNYERLQMVGFDLPDPVTVAAALYPEIVLERFDAYAYVDYKSEASYGQLVIDYLNVENREPNAAFCKIVDGELFKQRLYDLVVS